MDREIYDKYDRLAAVGIDVGVEPASSTRPLLHCRRGYETFVLFRTEQDEYGRLTFDRLDAIRMSRGEESPYRTASSSWVCRVLESPWHAERFRYESVNYGGCYEFMGDVNDMLRDYSHYVFEFPDEFIECICAGFWIETSKTPFVDSSPTVGHPLSCLPIEHTREVIADGERQLDVRVNPLPLDSLTKAARLCEQPLLQVCPSGRTDRVIWGLHLRDRDGHLESRLSHTWRGTVARFPGVAGWDDVQQLIVRR